MVDEERVTRLLTRIRDDLTTLGRAAEKGPATVAANDVMLDAVKYRFVTAIEGCVRVAQHLLASESWGVPDTNASAFRELGGHDVLDEPTAYAMSRAVGFRNVLVHEYADVDDDRVVQQLAHLGDLQEFVRQVADWVVASRHR